MIEQKIKQIIVENIDLQIPLHDIGPGLELSDIGVNSIIFIKLVVAIENEFGFEFDGDDLDFRSFPNFETLVSYIQSKVS